MLHFLDGLRRDLVDALRTDRFDDHFIYFQTACRHLEAGYIIGRYKIGIRRAAAVMVLHFFDQFQAGHFRHDHVGDQNVHTLVLDLVQRLMTADGGYHVHRWPDLRKGTRQGICRVWVVIDHQNTDLIMRRYIHPSHFPAKSPTRRWTREGKVGESWHARRRRTRFRPSRKRVLRLESESTLRV